MRVSTTDLVLPHNDHWRRGNPASWCPCPANERPLVTGDHVGLYEVSGYGAPKFCRNGCNPDADFRFSGELRSGFIRGHQNGWQIFAVGK